MKRLLRAIFLALLLTGLVPCILIGVDKAAGNVYEDTYYGQLPAMANKAYQAEGKKLLVIGTSSVAFGLDSALLQDLLQEVSCDTRSAALACTGPSARRPCWSCQRTACTKAT